MGTRPNVGRGIGMALASLGGSMQEEQVRKQRMAEIEQLRQQEFMYKQMLEDQANPVLYHANPQVGPTLGGAPQMGLPDMMGPQQGVTWNSDIRSNDLNAPASSLKAGLLRSRLGVPEADPNEGKMRVVGADGQAYWVSPAQALAYNNPGTESPDRMMTIPVPPDKRASLGGLDSLTVPESQAGAWWSRLYPRETGGGANTGAQSVGDRTNFLQSALGSSKSGGGTTTTYNPDGSVRQMDRETTSFEPGTLLQDQYDPFGLAQAYTAAADSAVQAGRNFDEQSLPAEIAAAVGVDRYLADTASVGEMVPQIHAMFGQQIAPGGSGKNWAYDAKRGKWRRDKQGFGGGSEDVSPEDFYGKGGAGYDAYLNVVAKALADGTDKVEVEALNTVAKEKGIDLRDLLRQLQEAEKDKPFATEALIMAKHKVNIKVAMPGGDKFLLTNGKVVDATGKVIDQ